MTGDSAPLLMETKSVIVPIGNIYWVMYCYIERFSVFRSTTAQLQISVCQCWVWNQRECHHEVYYKMLLVQMESYPVARIPFDKAIFYWI